MLKTLVAILEQQMCQLTPAEEYQFSKHVHGYPASSDFHYSSLVRMPLYLASHTHSDITYPVINDAWCEFLSKLMHEHALKKLVAASYCQ